MSPNVCVGGGGGGCGVLAIECSCSHEAQINFGELTPQLTYGQNWAASTNFTQGTIPGAARTHQFSGSTDLIQYTISDLTNTIQLNLWTETQI